MDGTKIRKCLRACNVFQHPHPPKCSSRLPSPQLSWLSPVINAILIRFDHRLLTILIGLATASAFAGPIPAEALQKKELGAIDPNIFAREPGSQNHEVENLARGPPPLCSTEKMCQ